MIENFFIFNTFFHTYTPRRFEFHSQYREMESRHPIFEVDSKVFYFNEMGWPVAGRVSKVGPRQIRVCLVKMYHEAVDGNSQSLIPDFKALSGAEVRFHLTADGSYEREGVKLDLYPEGTVLMKK